jgi:hypothetical protein
MSPEDTERFDVLVAMKTKACYDREALKGLIASVRQNEVTLLGELTDALYNVNTYISSLDHAIVRGFVSS